MGDSVLGDLIKEEAYKDAFKISYTKWEPPKEIKKINRISICTTCMGRCSDIKQTYIKNIEDNKDYPKIEFVLLNYNSQDDLDQYVKANLMVYIEKRILNYYKTIEPKYYSMTKSRNINIRVARGDIVNNVDADHFIHKGFAEQINKIANVFPERVVFCKSKYKNRGRVGLYRKEAIKLLGGYDEIIEGYGFDDHNLVSRAVKLGFKAVKFGGDFCDITEDHRRHPIDNYENKDWKYTQRKNTLISLLNIKLERYQANRKQHWGKAHLLKNFKEEIDI